MHLSSSMSLQIARTPDLVIGFPCSEWRLSVVRTKFPMLYDSNMPCGVMREREWEEGREESEWVGETEMHR